MLVLEDQAIAEVFKEFFIKIVPNLKISTDHDYDIDFNVTDELQTLSISIGIIQIPLWSRTRKELIKLFLLVP